jgi:hypothetical protein
VGAALVVVGLAAARAGEAQARSVAPWDTPAPLGTTPAAMLTPIPTSTPTVTPTPDPAVPTATPAPPSRRTFCVEWIRQTREGYERITLFADRMLVWKTSRDGKEDILRKQLAADELTFYCDYFSSDESFAIPSDMRTGLSGEFAPTSSITLARADGLQKKIRFDDFSPLTAQAAGIRAALEGLKTMLTSPLAPASRFAPEVLAVGQILKRFDGAYFRIRTLEKEKGIVEIEGVREPYREFRRIEDLRFQFSPPE